MKVENVFNFLEASRNAGRHCARLSAHCSTRSPNYVRQWRRPRTSSSCSIYMQARRCKLGRELFSFSVCVPNARCRLGTSSRSPRDLGAIWSVQKSCIHPNESFPIPSLISHFNAQSIQQGSWSTTWPTSRSAPPKPCRIDQVRCNVFALAQSVFNHSRLTTWRNPSCP